MKLTKNKSGFSLVEILLAISIFSIFTIGIAYLSLDTLGRDATVKISNEALLYAQEGLEATRNIRDKDFLALENGTYGLTLVSNSWSYNEAPELIDNFYERTITISDVYRDEGGNISEDGITVDDDMKKVESAISWMQNGLIPRSIILTEYLSNWRTDDILRTTCTEFSSGTFDNTEVTALPGPPTDNCGIRITELVGETTYVSSSDVGKHGNDVTVEGNYAYLATEDTNRGLNIIDISNRQIPTIVGYKNLGGKGRYIVKDGNYVYLGVEKSSSGEAIVDVTNPASPLTASTINLGDYGNQPAVTGNYLYATISQITNGLKIYNITTKSSPTISRTVNLASTISVLKIRGNYAYVGLVNNTSGFKILDISNPTNPVLVGSLNVGGQVKAVELNGNIAYVGINNTSNSLKIIDITNPAAPSLVTSIDTNGKIEDLVVSGNYLYAAIDKVGAGLAAINISNTYAPYYLYSFDIGGKGTGIDADTDHIYISTDTANRGMVIVGETASGVATSGSYTSDVLDTTSSDTDYHFIEWENTYVPGSTIQFQIKTADSIENLDTAVWVGPDGTNSTFYNDTRTPIVLSSTSSGKRYMQYKAFLASDGVTSPILDSVRINYTP